MRLEGKSALRGHRDLKVYQLAYKLAMENYNESKSFPIEERYSLTDQIRRSSRSVAANVAEAYRKRRYPKVFVSQVADADGEARETQVWLDFARDCEYLSRERHSQLTAGYEEVGRMLGGMIDHPESITAVRRGGGKQYAGSRNREARNGSRETEAAFLPPADCVLPSTRAYWILPSACCHLMREFKICNVKFAMGGPWPKNPSCWWKTIRTTWRLPCGP